MKNFENMSLLVSLILSTLFTANVGFSAEIETPDHMPLEVHGFVSQGFMMSTDNNYIMESKQGNFEFTEVGINFSKPLTEKLRVGLQLFSRKLGGVGNFNVKADWFFLDYRFSDEFGLRAGRVKLPFGLYNDTSDIDAARVPVLLPQSIYPIRNRDYLLAQTGGELYGRVKMANAGTIDYRAYGGAIQFDIEARQGSAVVLSDLNNRYVVGGRILWETPVEGLRLGPSLQSLRLDADVVASPTATAAIEVPVVMYVGSIEYAFRDLLLSAEYSRWYVSVNSHNETAFPSRPTVVSERAYAMASYRFNSWFQPGAYYSIFYRDTADRSLSENKQHDVAGTLRFDINSNWLVKLEGHYMHGTGGLVSGLNNNVPLASLDDDWLAFLIKTTVFF